MWGETVTKTESFSMASKNPIDGWSCTNQTTYCGLYYSGGKSKGCVVANKAINNFSQVDFSAVSNATVTITVKGVTNSGTNKYTVSLIDKDGNIVGSSQSVSDKLGVGSNANSAKESSVTLTPVSGVTGYQIEFFAKGACHSTSYTLTYETSGSTTETCATPTFNPAAGTYTSAQNVTISTATDGAIIYYTTDGTDPTTSSSVYNSSINVSQTTTIKAIAVKEGIDNSAVATAEYTIVNLEHAGTEADPYTVADARTAIDANIGKEGVYATGVVSEIVTAYNSKYGNISFDFVDSEGDSNTLRAYRCTGEEAANVQVGDIVVVSGDLTKYISTYEFGEGCALVSRTSSSTKVAADLAFSATTASADLANPSAFTAPTLTNPYSLAVTYTSSDTEVATVAADGTVTILAEGSTTITASSEETEQYLAGTASYRLTVTSSNKQLVTVDADGNVTFDLSDNGWGFPDGSSHKTTDERSYTADGYTITLAGGGSGNGHYFNATDKYLMLGKSDATLTLPAFDFAVEKIEVVGRTGASGKVTQNIFVGQTAVSTETTGATGTNTYVIAEDNQAAGTIYTLKVTNANNTQIISIKVYKGTVDEREEVTLSFTSVPATIVVDETATYTATATPSVTGITYSSSDENVLMVDETTGEIAALAVGEATITASFAGNETYKPATASYTITVVAPQHTAKFFVNGEEQTEAEAQVAEGAAITFPTAPETIEEKTFVGWTTAAIDGETDNAPTFVTSATMGSADVTYYAVYANQEGEGGSSTATLTEAEIKANFTAEVHKYADGEVAYNDTEDGINWMASYNVDAANRPWIQLKKDATAYLKINASSNISEVKLTITAASNSSGGIGDIAKHNPFGGEVYLETEASSSPTGALGSSDEVANNVVTLIPNSLVQELFIQVSAAARIWGVEVTSGTPATYSGYCTTVSQPEPVSVTISAAGYSTLYYGTKNLTVPTGMEAYTVKVTTQVERSTTYNAGDVIPAGTGVVLKAAQGTYEFAVAAEAGAQDANNMLRGNDVKATTTGGTYYYALTLDKNKQNPGFYWMVENGGAYQAGAHKAYLALDKTFAELAEGSETGVKGFLALPGDGIVTGIEAMDNGQWTMDNAEIYNLAGQRVKKMQKGIYVVGGKKVMVK